MLTASIQTPGAIFADHLPAAADADSAHAAVGHPSAGHRRDNQHHLLRFKRDFGLLTDPQPLNATLAGTRASRR